jgi:uncharacterized caspase-like protein
VGAYANKEIQQLPGPPNDARAMATMLSRRYGFPARNVCTLLNEQATVAAFEDAWERALVARARAGDTAVFYFAGHGSQMTDDSGDEPSGMDQTLVLHDSRTGRVTDLRDDRLNQLLARLYKKTSNVVVIADSCNSGSVTRGAAGRALARTIPAPGQTAPASGFVAGASWMPATLPGLVALSAAADGTSALEVDGHGVFTDALIQVLNQPGSTLTYAQLARQVPGLMAARSPQVPYFQGKLSREAFGASTLPRPIAWEVTRVAGATVELAGAPMPGLGANAELRVFDPRGRKEDFGDPTKAKATLLVKAVQGLTATATRLSPGPAVAPGDLALLARPGDGASQVTVRLRPATEAGGLLEPRAQALRAAIARSRDAKAAVTATDGAGTFELSMLRDGRLQLRGLANEVRAVFANDDDVVPVLWQLARQQALASLHGEGRPFFRDEESLKVDIVPAGLAEQGPCGARKIADFVPRAAGQAVQTIGLCTVYQVKVTLAANAGQPVLVGGVMLSGDGRTYGFPMDGSVIELKPGESHVFAQPFRAGPPIGVNDTLRVFGTLKKNPVAWSVLTDDWRSRGARPTVSPLHRALERYLVAGSRGMQLDQPEPQADTQWTVSTVTLRVEANPRPPATKAFVDFDVRPYLPDDATSATHRVLRAADDLVRRQAAAPSPFKVAALDGGQQLPVNGVRAAMEVFTQARLPFGKDGRAVTAAEMGRPASPMVDSFARCDGHAAQLGDLLVFGDRLRGERFVTMVIDPQRRIAWGSLSWDGDPPRGKPPAAASLGFQLLRDREDWRRAGRDDVALMACWRHRQLADEARSGRGLPGLDALERHLCEPQGDCGSRSP